MDRLDLARQVFDIEIDALKKTRDALDESYTAILDKIVNCRGKVIITGMGKPGHIAKKISATLASLGTPSFFLHPAEALHGDLGMVDRSDVVIVISYSGESDEIIHILPNIKLMGAMVIALSGNPTSTLVKHSDLSFIFPKFEEACLLGLAPTSSTTATLVWGDSLAVVAADSLNFTTEDYGQRHPAGALGKRVLLKVGDLMKQGEENAVVSQRASLHEAIVEMSKKGLGLVSVVDVDGHLVGVITDGDLRRLLEKRVDIYTLMVKDAMTLNPVTVIEDEMAVDALHRMQKRNVNCLPVLDVDGCVVGTVTQHIILSAGII